MALRLVAPPVDEPITLEEAKAHLRVEHDEEDSQIQAWITSARMAAENDTKRVYVTQTWELVLNDLPQGGLIKIPPPVTPVQEILSIKVGGTEESLENFAIDIFNAQIVPKAGYALPKSNSPVSSIVVTFKAGFGEPESVPAPLKSAILLRVGHLYLHREAVGASNLSEVPMAVKHLELPYRDVRVI
jgi:uncharacterized phiE125 gp8 family phage protein